MGIQDKGPALIPTIIMEGTPGAVSPNVKFVEKPHLSNTRFIEKLMEVVIVDKPFSATIHDVMSVEGGGRPPICDKCLMRKAIARFGRRYCQQCCPCVQCERARHE